MKILIVTDSHVLPTGLAETTRLLFDSLRKYHPDIYEIEQIGLFHCYAVCQPSWKIHPTKLIRGPGSQFTFDEGDKYGAKTYKKVLQSFSPDIVFGFGDPDRLLFLCTPSANRRHKVILYLNFDGFPVPKAMGDKLDLADKITVKSDFCYHIVRRYFPQIAGDKVHIVPSPADTDRFFKFSEQEKRELRQDVLPTWVPEKAFILGWVGRNQWRKQIWTLFAALSSIRKGRYFVCDACDHAVVPEDVLNHSQTDPQVALGDHDEPPKFCPYCGGNQFTHADPIEDIFLWLHMPQDEPDGDWPLDVLYQIYQVEPDRDFFYTPEHSHKSAFAPQDMPLIFNCFDAMLFLSGGEGFGLPPWEAMASELPVIYTNYSAHGAFLNKAKAGIPVNGVLQPEAETGVLRLIADPSQTVNAIRKLYHDKGLRAELGGHGRSYVSQHSPESVAHTWHDIFNCVHASG